MIVADMYALIVAARHFAEAADISAAAKGKLGSLCEALEPFRAMEVTAFSELLRQAEVYRQTGELPVPTKPARGGANKGRPNADELAQRAAIILQQLHNLYAVVHEESVGFGAIDEICAAIGKLGPPEVKLIAEQFGIKVSSKLSRPKAIEEIKRKLTEQKGSAQRIKPIATG